MIEQLVEQYGEPVTRPRPPPFAAFFFFGEAFFIGVEDDNARINGARHRKREAGVINDGFKALDQRQTVIFCRVANEDQHEQQAQTNTNAMFLQTASCAAIRFKAASNSAV